MRKILLVVLTLYLLATSAVKAQGQLFLQWDQGETLTVVQTYTYTLSIDGANAAPAPATCTANGTATRCNTPIALGPGQHTLILTAKNTAGQATLSDPATLGAPIAPTKPVNMTIIVTVTVTVPQP